MLFVFVASVPLALWTKNRLIPLDIPRLDGARKPVSAPHDVRRVGRSLPARPGTGATRYVRNRQPVRHDVSTCKLESI